MIRKPSIEAAADFKDESMDFIFVDGDHSYEGTLADCIAYYPKLKKGGFFCGHDYNSIKAVADAVNAFRYEEKIKSPFNISLNSTFFWYK
jgi:hypothetical protein